MRLFVVLCGYPHNILIKTNVVLNWKSSYLLIIALDLMDQVTGSVAKNIC
jgi:hypothetical protein